MDALVVKIVSKDRIRRWEFEAEFGVEFQKMEFLRK